MNQIKRIGIDTATAVFTLHCVEQDGRMVRQLTLRRARLRPCPRKLPPTRSAREACATAHYWARELTELGHQVRLSALTACRCIGALCGPIPPHHVKPCVKRGKNHRHDAAAIRQAASRPEMRFVPVKSAQQRAQAMLLKLRDTRVAQRTQLINTRRGHAAEFGVIAARGTSQVSALLKVIEADTTVPAEAGAMPAPLGEEIARLEARIGEIDAKLHAAPQANRLSRRLATIPGVGPLTALTLALEVDPAGFKSGRHRAAWIGLTPREHATGGKPRLGGISRAGHERLRQLLVRGATTVIRYAAQPGHELATPWLTRLLARRPRKLAAVALANKQARTAGARLAQVPANRWRLAGRPRRGDDDERRGLPPTRPRGLSRSQARVSELTKMTIGRTDDPHSPSPPMADQAAGLLRRGSRTPSGPAVMTPRQQAGQMIAVEPLSNLSDPLAPEGPSTHGEASEHARQGAARNQWDTGRHSNLARVNHYAGRYKMV